MTRMLLSGIALLTLGALGQATAADMPVKAWAPAPAPFSWTGFYVGLEAGYGWGDSKQTTTTPSANFLIGSRINTIKMDGLLGGGVVGADYQWTTNWLIGVKGTFDAADINGSSITAATASPNTITSYQRLDWVATAVGRVGFIPWSTLLLYADGGGAWAHSKREGNTYDPAGVNVGMSSGSETLSGWTAGVGAEYMLTHHLSWVTEYNYIDFGTKAVNSTILTGAFVGVVNGRNAANTLNVFKSGLNYRF